MSPADFASYTRFSFRCSASAMIAYGVAVAFQLDHPMWAPISALVVSRDSVAETMQSVGGRFIGTIVGAVVAVAAYEIGECFDWSAILQLGIAVAIAALAAKSRPSIRVCMWTSAVVLLTATPGVSISLTAISRSSEVIVGMATSIVIYVIDERLLQWIRQRRAQLRSKRPNQVLDSHITPPRPTSTP